MIAAVVSAVRPAGYGPAWQDLEAERERITAWVGQGLTVVEIGTLLQRRGVTMPYCTLHRFCLQHCGFGRAGETVRVADGDPGVEVQVDFGQLGLLLAARAFHASSRRGEGVHRAGVGVDRRDATVRQRNPAAPDRRRHGPPKRTNH